MERERGRHMSRSTPHISPIPSPHNYHDAVTGFEGSPFVSTTAGYNPSVPAHNISFTSQQSNDAQYSSQSASQQQYLDSYMPQMDSTNNNNNSNDAYAQTLNMTAINHSFANSFQYPNEYQDLSMNQFNINPADLSQMSSPADHNSPRLLSPDNHPSAPQSPALTNAQFHTPQHSRNTSLDPSSAYQDWQGMSFRQHQRSQSDVSDVSSVQNSPYMPHVDLEPSHSPLFPSQDNLGLDQGFDQFTIADQSSQPGPTYVSPRLIPQQEGLGIGQDGSLNTAYQIQQDMYPPVPMHNRHQSVVSDIGQADQFAPPTINIEPAPISRQGSFEPSGQEPDGLSPPANSSRGRHRSQSDVTFTRPMTSRSGSPSPRPKSDSLSVGRSSSPAGFSRSPSPGITDGRISKDRRASTSAINSNNREYILDLADPNRPNGSTSNSTRVQKHPATFQCTLCPKRFTRAYNLRSHLRTHTDERPFVCTVCGKAFARQHDRKRHEGLHSGEKKFICKGELSHSPGQTWGCGRRFARADALGRHFRSEAGRVCIKPLLDEEAAERRNKMMMEQTHHVQSQMLQPVPQPMMVSDLSGGFALPAALLAQYPALQNIDWSALQQQGDEGDLSDIGVGPYDDGGMSDGGSYGHNAHWQ